MRAELKHVVQNPSLVMIPVFIALGAFLVRTSESSSALAWMHIYDPGDFVDASVPDVGAFFRDLMIPIPPLVGLAEILSIQFLGSPILVTNYAYRLALVGSYVLAIGLAATSRKRSMAAFLVAVLFLYVTTKVHPGDPQNYDIFFPFGFLLFILALRSAVITGSSAFLPLLAGFFLALTELTRPFVLYLMPLPLAGAYFALARVGRRRHFLSFLAPILLISGGWHTHLLAAHHQLSLSNNAGYNIARAWPQIPAVQLIDEPHYAPLAPGRWANLNTEEHGENSRRAQLSQLRYWIAHPLDSLLFTASRLAELLRGDTAFGGFVPQSRWFGAYAISVRLISSLFILGAGVIAAAACLHPRRIPSLLAQTDNLTILFTLGCAVLLAAGEIREEPRLLLSLLPMLAMLPLFRLTEPESVDIHAVHVSTTW